jgi:hypothetical protein
MKIYISIFIVLVATGVLLSANKWLQQRRFLFSNNAYVDDQIKYQTLLLLTALGVLIWVYLLNKESFISLYRQYQCAYRKNDAIWHKRRR